MNKLIYSKFLIHYKKAIFSLCILVLCYSCEQQEEPKPAPKKVKIPELRVGDLLIANGIHSGPFAAKVILLIQVKDKFISGVIINNQPKISMASLSKKFKGIKTSVTNGGPINFKKDLIAVHTISNLDKAVKAKEGLYIFGNIDNILPKLKAQVYTDTDIKLFTGYCTWSKAQFTQEYASGAWIHWYKYKNSQILKKDTKAMWNDFIYELNH
jgi:putative AlgH/UPF0301 family transcriptional regulator